MQVERYDVVIGTNLFVNTPCAIGIRMQDRTIRPVLHVCLSASAHKFLVSLDAVDHTGARLRLQGSEAVGADAERFEVLRLSREIRILNRKTGGVVAEIRYKKELEIYGDFSCDGIRLVASPEYLMIQNLRVYGHRYGNLGGILLSPTVGLVSNFLGTIPPLPID